MIARLYRFVCKQGVPAATPASLGRSGRHHRSTSLKRPKRARKKGRAQIRYRRAPNKQQYMHTVHIHMHTSGGQSSHMHCRTVASITPFRPPFAQARMVHSGPHCHKRWSHGGVFSETSHHTPMHTQIRITQHMHMGACTLIPHHTTYAHLHAHAHVHVQLDLGVQP